MAEKLVKWFMGIFGGLLSTTLSKYIFIFIISASPILELRGGILAASLLGLDSLTSYIVCVIANILPIPFILMLLDKIFEFMKKHHIMDKIIVKLENKALKNKEKIDKYGYLALLIFVAVPLPGSGGWTGALIASVLKMNRKKSFLVILGGILIASIIMMLISYGLLKSVL